MDYIQVEGEDGLYRDPSSGAIINRDKKAFEQIRAARSRSKHTDIEMQQLRDEITELKSMLHAIINRSDNS
tara:strand:+ start:648 stop:860 length:213 start_codon:yes stop_codon:yes gene_type:complete